MTMRPVNAEHAPRASGGYSQALEVSGFSRLLFVSGQVPVSVDGEVPQSFDAQCRAVWANIAAQLQAAGFGLDQIVKITTFLSDRQHASENSAIRNEVLRGHAPALTVIIAGIYDPSWLLEIEVVAAA